MDFVKPVINILKENMNNELIAAYAAKDSVSLNLGGIIFNNQLIAKAPVNLVLKAFNRHGLIAGATGSGKTKTIQVLCEQLSQQGVPSLVMDIKGDLSGLAVPGVQTAQLSARNQQLNLSFIPQGFPVELLTLTSQSPGTRVRSTVQEFGATLFSRLLELNAVQEAVMTVIFAYAENEHYPLIELANVKALLNFLTTDSGKATIEKQYGSISNTSLTIILRKIIELEQGGVTDFFGEPVFQIKDLIRHNSNGEGIISILRLLDMQSSPKLFSTFMLKLLADLYKNLPELGDPEKPLLVLFIDEAHLMFKQASRALLDMLETIVKLIRSKGVGLIFCTQTAKDIPDSVLSQLGLKIQHALRAFTAKDRQGMKLIAQNFPYSEDYNVEQLLTSLGVGEALVCALDEKMQPLPVVQCQVRAPVSRMGVLSELEINTIVNQSPLRAYYSKKIHPANAKLPDNELNDKATKKSRAKNSNLKKDPSVIESLSKNTLFRQLIRQFFQRITSEIIKLLKK